MKKRSINIPRLLAGGILFCVILGAYTTVFLRLDSFIIDAVGMIIFSSRQLVHPGRVVNIDIPSSQSIRVIAKHADEFQSTLLINTSAPQGAKVVANDLLVGSVRESGSRASKVEITSSPSAHTRGVLGRSGIPLDCIGKGAQLIEAELPKGSDVAIGDVIYNDEGRVFVIGSVIRVEDVPSEPFMKLFIQQAVNTETLTAVSIYGN